MNESNIPRMFEQAGKVVAGLILLAANNKHDRGRNHRHTHRRERFEREPRRPHGAFPSVMIGGVMIALGFLMLMVMIGPSLLVNMGLAMTFCLAPLAIIALIAITAMRKPQNHARRRAGDDVGDPHRRAACRSRSRPSA